MKRLAIPLIAVMLIAATPAQAETRDITPAPSQCAVHQRTLTDVLTTIYTSSQATDLPRKVTVSWKCLSPIVAVKCLAWETDTYLGGTYFIHHAHYDTVGPLPALVITKCIQYKEATK